MTTLIENLASKAFAAAIDAAYVATSRFNALPASLEADNPAAHESAEEAMFAASRAADAAIPTNWQDFTRWVEHVTDGGESTLDEKNGSRLLAHVRRLAGEA